jgi:hypothetical protein
MKRLDYGRFVGLFRSKSRIRLWFALAVIILTVGQGSADDDTIETKYGKLKGTIEDGYSGRKALVFRGVPFAQPPIGPLRFHDPKPIDKFASDPFEVKSFEIASQSFTRFVVIR